MVICISSPFPVQSYLFQLLFSALTNYGTARRRLWGLSLTEKLLKSDTSLRRERWISQKVFLKVLKNVLSVPKPELGLDI